MKLAFFCCLVLFYGFSSESYPIGFEEYSIESEQYQPDEDPLLFPELLDLQDLKQDFVLETRQIRIEGYPSALNPSIVRWRGSYLMSFRIREEKTGAVNDVGMIWLDDFFNPIGKPSVLELLIDRPSLPSKVQDPRLITLDNRLYLVYSNMIFRDENFREIKRMYIGEVEFDGRSFRIEYPECLYHFNNANDRWEKNWVPFIYQDQLLLAYSLTPHRILWPMRRTRECIEFVTTESSIIWPWGSLRGGTQAILDGDHYISFFHSSIQKMATINSDKEIMHHYFMGAYTFSSTPPFKITKISPAPIVGDKFYRGPAHKTWKPLRVVFPGGIVVGEEFIWVFYGRQDHEIWVAKLDKKKLMDSLVPVE